LSFHHLPSIRVRVEDVGILDIGDVSSDNFLRYGILCLLRNRTDNPVELNRLGALFKPYNLRNPRVEGLTYLLHKIALDHFQLSFFHFNRVSIWAKNVSARWLSIIHHTFVIEKLLTEWVGLIRCLFSDRRNQPIFIE
uniref:FBD domain-containing protein n=1 Tax=Haemonchus placei TaxID=6290 RepID=A0A0N4W3Z5_HAEPC